MLQRYMFKSTFYYRIFWLKMRLIIIICRPLFWQHQSRKNFPILIIYELDYRMSNRIRILLLQRVIYCSLLKRYATRGNSLVGVLSSLLYNLTLNSVLLKLEESPVLAKNFLKIYLQSL